MGTLDASFLVSKELVGTSKKLWLESFTVLYLFIYLIIEHHAVGPRKRVRRP